MEHSFGYPTSTKIDNTLWPTQIMLSMQYIFSPLKPFIMVLIFIRPISPHQCPILNPNVPPKLWDVLNHCFLSTALGHLISSAISLFDTWSNKNGIIIECRPQPSPQHRVKVDDIVKFHVEYKVEKPLLGHKLRRMTRDYVAPLCTVHGCG